MRGLLRRIGGALRGEHYDYTQGSLHSAIWLLAVPMVLEMSLEALFAIVDIWWVNKIDAGWFGATPTKGAAAAVITTTEGMLSIVYAIAFGIGMSVTALVARRVGEKNIRGAEIAAAQGMGLAVVLGVVSGVPLVVFAPDLLRLMNAGEPAVTELGAGYARWMLGGNVIVLLLFLQNAVFRGAGDPFLALKTLALANGINLVLDPVLIFGLGPFPALGVTGAAVATCTGRSIAVLYQAWALARGSARVRVRPRDVRLDVAAMTNLLRLSAGTVGQFLIATSSWVMLVRIVAEYGKEATAGYGTAIRILMFTLLPAWGLSNAAATLVGQNLGAGKPDRAERSVWLVGLYDMAFLAAVTLAMELFAWQIAAEFNEDPAVAAHVVAALRIITVGYVFFGWGMVTTQAFNGAGDGATATWLNFWFFWVLELPLAWLLAKTAGIGPNGVFWSITIAESAFAVAAVIVFRRGRWKTRRV